MSTWRDLFTHCVWEIKVQNLIILLNSWWRLRLPPSVNLLNSSHSTIIFMCLPKLLLPSAELKANSFDGCLSSLKYGDVFVTVVVLHCFGHHQLQKMQICAKCQVIQVFNWIWAGKWHEIDFFSSFFCFHKYIKWLIPHVVRLYWMSDYQILYSLIPCLKPFTSSFMKGKFD